MCTGLCASHRGFGLTLSSIMTNRRGWQEGFHPRTTCRNTRGLTAYCVPADLQAISFVQQLCSNPSESPEMLRKVPTQKYGDLQEFCNLQKPPAYLHTAFTRQRTLVRAQHRPLCIHLGLQGKHKRSMTPPKPLQDLAQQPCSNAERREPRRAAGARC